ncbi:MAG: Daunorubicin resistance ABC transporter ATPase subunit [candidate division TM6 bacterium GW2011_GWF2_32_72]|nr:MAG: Daunorubicin resistance ABC transporter ATPase subunit [candidate division TM6 bacterium GW2011_GWF2_32_72]
MKNMNEKLIEIKNIKKYYKIGRPDEIRALNGVSFDINKAETLGLLGVNGAGKTTLSSILATLHPATSGDILCEGKSIYNDIVDFRYKVGFCPQKPNLYVDLTVEQILLFSGRYYGLPEDEIRNRMEELIQRYQLGKYRKMKPEVLSGGYSHRLLIARSLMHNPKLLILDEPTVGLDPHIRFKLWDNIKELKSLGVSVVLTTHYLDEADVLSDRICVLEKGLVKLIDTPTNLKQKYQEESLEKIFIKLMEEETE